MQCEERTWRNARGGPKWDADQNIHDKMVSTSRKAEKLLRALDRRRGVLSSWSSSFDGSGMPGRSDVSGGMTLLLLWTVGRVGSHLRAAPSELLSSPDKVQVMLRYL